MTKKKSKAGDLVFIGRSAWPNPGLTLLIKLGSLAIHTEELLGAGGHQFDLSVIQGLLNDPEVKDWLARGTELAWLPVKRG